MKALDSKEHQFAEVTALLLVKAAEVGLPDSPDKLGVTPRALSLLARAHVELRTRVRALHDLVDQTDPHDPIGVGLTKAGLERRWADPSAAATTPLLVVKSPEEVKAMRAFELRSIYCCVMQEIASVFDTYETYIVRLWDGMDGCWTDCTKEVGQEEALRYWAERTDGGARRISFKEIDYYKIFPGGTHMGWDGSEGREMHR
jgi:hypothetical protein